MSQPEMPGAQVWMYFSASTARPLRRAPQLVESALGKDAPTCFRQVAAAVVLLFRYTPNCVSMP
jgi:hypothetical protein